MSFHRVARAIVGLTAISAVWGGIAYAEPAQDAVAKFQDLRQQAEQLTAAVGAAQSDLDEKMRLQGEADAKHAGDLQALDAAKAQLAVYQSDVDKVATAVYVGGRTDDFTTILTAESPKKLIDTLAVQRTLFTGVSEQMKSYRRVTEEVQAVEAASAKSAADAHAAADAAAAVRAELQNKETQLRARIAEVRVRYASLTAAQQAVLGPGGAIPLVGMSGLVPNAQMLVQYIITTYPGVQSIGGVRADALPDHPSGHAVDIMIGSDMGLGDAINADVQSQAARFGVSYTMWRVANHYNHVHVTVN